MIIAAWESGEISEGIVAREPCVGRIDARELRNANLVHYTSKPISELYSVNKQKIDKKPSGFWVSVETGNEDGWKDWCHSEEWNLEAFDLTYIVELREGANILTISTVAELYKFNAIHSVKDKRDIIKVDWNEVAKKYDGIVIAPYIYSCKMDEGVGWYYGWDCASGCIWNIEAIEKVCEVESVGV